MLYQGLDSSSETFHKNEQALVWAAFGAWLERLAEASASAIRSAHGGTTAAVQAVACLSLLLLLLPSANTAPFLARGRLGSLNSTCTACAGRPSLLPLKTSSVLFSIDGRLSPLRPRYLSPMNSGLIFNSFLHSTLPCLFAELHPLAARSCLLR